jgi:2,4-dienoyl-CoA reductase-like NADH-dependent reductase (Old Yellow Enzyme family)
MATLLFSPLCLRELAFKNRIFVSPMCQYSGIDGMPTDWHLVHLGSRAVGGAALVMVEATAVVPEGRITPNDTGIWTDAHAAAFQRIAAFISAQGAVPGIQIAHAGRKASTDRPWLGGNPLKPGGGGWQPVGPSALPFASNYNLPRELSPAEIGGLVERFADAAKHALTAGFKVIEIHMAHGYLLHSFLSPLSNLRTDEFGEDFDGRTRFPIQVAKAVRDVWPTSLPVFVRISSTDWVEGGWDLGQSIRFSRRLRDIGIDMIDCSSGGLTVDAKIPVSPGFQVPFAAAIRREVKMPTATVGLITNPQQAEQTLVCGDADAVFLARQMLRDPYWPLHAARSLGEDVPWPDPYARAKQ